MQTTDATRGLLKISLESQTRWNIFCMYLRRNGFSLVDGQFRNEDDAETGAELNGMNDTPLFPSSARQDSWYWIRTLVSCDYQGVLAAIWAPWVWWMWEGLCVFSGCTSVAGGSIHKAFSDSGLRHSGERGSRGSMNGFCDGDSNPSIKETTWFLHSATWTGSCACIPCAINASPFVTWTRMQIFWNVPAHSSIATVSQVARTILQHGCENALDTWHISSRNQCEEVKDSSSWCCVRHACITDSCQRQDCWVLRWFSILRKPDQAVAQDKDVQGRSNAGAFYNVLDVIEWGTWKGNGHE